MRAGGIGLCFATFIARARRNGSGSIDVGTHEAAHAHAMGQFSYYREMERQGAVRIITDSAALDAHINEWNADPETTPLGLMLSMEGADPIVELGSLGSMERIGLRISVWPTTARANTPGEPEPTARSNRPAQAPGRNGANQH